MKFKRYNRFKHYEAWIHRNETYNCRVFIMKFPQGKLSKHVFFHYRVVGIDANYASIEHKEVFVTFEECSKSAEEWMRNNLFKVEKVYWKD